MRTRWFVLWAVTLLLGAGTYLSAPGWISYLIGIVLLLAFFGLIANRTP
jgi:UPF0716 family protein affecting phage T7 exclusion